MYSDPFSKDTEVGETLSSGHVRLNKSDSFLIHRGYFLEERLVFNIIQPWCLAEYTSATLNHWYPPPHEVSPIT